MSKDAMSKQDERSQNEKPEADAREVELSEEDLEAASGGTGDATTDHYTGPVAPIFLPSPLPLEDLPEGPRGGRDERVL